MTKESESNEWLTDRELFDKLCSTYDIYPTLDAAATRKNTLCRNFIDKREDALKANWHDGQFRYGDVWCSPPLNKGMCKKFVLKAEQEWRRHNMNIMMPLPIGVCSRKYFRHLWEDFKSSFGKTIDIDPIDRPKFSLNGKKKASARNDYMVLIFRKQ